MNNNNTFLFSYLLERQKHHNYIHYAAEVYSIRALHTVQCIALFALHSSGDSVSAILNTNLFDTHA